MALAAKGPDVLDQTVAFLAKREGIDKASWAALDPAGVPCIKEGAPPIASPASCGPRIIGFAPCLGTAPGVLCCLQ